MKFQSEHTHVTTIHIKILNITSTSEGLLMPPEYALKLVYANCNWQVKKKLLKKKVVKIGDIILISQRKQ